MPVTDECTQDWTLLSAEVGADGLIFEVERALDTDDSQDRVFADDSVEGDPIWHGCDTNHVLKTAMYIN